MYKHLFTAIIVFFPVAVLMAQTSPVIPKNYFRNPMGIPMQLTANFGELRTNRWHMGLDLRTQKKENLPVYAAAAGHISKIKIEPHGFGRSIFIDHPNGLTTVYGHLNDFFTELEKYVTEQQYKQESWEVELDFSKDKFRVYRGQLIAYSGNTGASSGPHLHFEIRNTKNGKCLNPLLFGFPVADNTAPEVLRLAMYDRDRSVYEQTPQIFNLKKTAQGYILPNVPVLKTGLQKVSFAIQALDRETKTGNPNGIYSAKIYFSEVPQISFQLDSMTYAESLYMNAHIDHPHKYRGGVHLQHLSQLPGDRGVVYRKINGNGVITLPDTNINAVLIEVKDIYKNTSLVSFNLQFDAGLAATGSQNKPGDKLLPNQANRIRKNDFEMEMPAHNLYDTVNVVYSRSVSASPYALSAVHMVNDPSIPVHNNFQVRIKPDRPVPDAVKDKLLIIRNPGYTVRKAQWQYEPTGIGWLTANFGDLGSFSIIMDTVPPQIKISRTGDTLDFSPDTAIVIEPADNNGIIKSFRAELNGKWIRFTNDKGRRFIYKFDERCPYGVHELTVTVEDLVGNKTTQSWWFKRNPYTAPLPKNKPAPQKKTAVKKK
jgi:murein DD-endopeptidase MepM/ murein hydrolase activator NlpD